MQCAHIRGLQILKMNIRSYSEMMQFGSFEERFEYLKLPGIVGRSTFGYSRYLNQLLYNSPEWKRARDAAIERDGGCDLGIEPIRIQILVHHINPLTPEDIINRTDKLFDLENLVTTMHKTHQALHYGDLSFLRDRRVIVRRPNDTVPWR